jgi:catechol 2,3-dioxygenase-like lactoylglutathione lyase family enzyme
MMLHDLAYIQLSVADLDRSIAFYRDTLGMRLLWREPEQGHAAVITSAGPLVLRADGGGNPDHRGPIIAFEVDDIQGMVAEYTARGVVFTSGIERHGGRFTARFLDPDGHQLELNRTMPHGTAPAT